MKHHITDRKMKYTSWSVPAIVVVLIFSCTTPSIIATREQQQGDYYNNLNQYQEAILHYEKYLEASKQLGIYRNLDMEADVCRKVANAYSTQGNFSKATSYVLKALELDSIQNNPLEIIEDYRMLGKINLYIGNYNQGIRFLEEALERNDGMENSLKAVNRLSIADTYLSLGQACNALGRLKKTELYTGIALSIYEEINDEQGMMEAKLILANSYILTGETKKANVLLQNSLDLARNLEVNGARQLQSMGESFEMEGEYEKALNSKLEALKEAEKSNIAPMILWSRIGIGDTYVKIGDLEKAFGYFDLSEQATREGSFQSRALGASLDMRLGDVQSAQQFFAGADALIAAGLASLRLGETKYQLGEVFSSLASYQQAKDYFKESGSSEGMAKAYLRIGHIRVDENDLSKARSDLLQAAELTNQQETKWQVSYHLGRLYEKDEKIDSAIRAYQEAIKIIEEIRGKFSVDEFKSIYIDDKIDVYDKLINLMLNINQEQDAYKYAQRGRSRAFLDMIGNKKVAVKPGTVPELVEREQELRFQIQQLTRTLMRNDFKTTDNPELRGEAKVQIENELIRTRGEYSDLLHQLKIKNRCYQSMVVVEPFELTDVQSELNNNTALLEYWISDQKLIIWVITKGCLHTIYSDIPAQRLQQSVLMCRRVLQYSSADASVNSLKSLYKDLFSPVEKLVTGYENLGIIPHKQLHFLPFQTLINPEGKYLVQEYNIFYAPSISVLKQCMTERYTQSNGFLAMALGDISLGNYSGLPGTTKEVQYISKHFPGGTTLYEEETTESFLKKNASNYKYLHLATHGLLNPIQPTYSYLLFTPTETDDGQLAVHEVFGLDLRARLVTLSACQTGLGEISNGDEMVGLSRAFLYAGTPAVVVSLWSVADEPTALLMSRFYEYVKHNNLQKALTLAQRDVLKEYKSPFFWAPFQLIGYGGE